MGRRVDHPWVDDSEWPLLRVAYPSKYTFEDAVRLFQAVEAFYARNREPFAWLVDTRNVGVADAKIRQVTAEHEDRTKDHKREYNRGSAFVVSSPLMRGVLTAIFWVAPPVYPHEVVATVDAARAWALGQLRKSTPEVSVSP